MKYIEFRILCAAVGMLHLPDGRFVISTQEGPALLVHGDGASWGFVRMTVG